MKMAEEPPDTGSEDVLDLGLVASRTLRIEAAAPVWLKITH